MVFRVDIRRLRSSCILYIPRLVLFFSEFIVATELSFLQPLLRKLGWIGRSLAFIWSFVTFIFSLFEKIFCH